MKTTALLLAVLLLAGCNALGGVQPDLATAAKNAGVSCVRVKSLVMGDAVAVQVNDTKGALQDGSITVDPDTCRITVTNSAAVKVAPVVKTTTGSSTTTVVTKPQ